jgi:hypothetical protein
MAVDFSDPVVRARSLAQGLPLSEEGYRFLNRVVAEERLRQPYPDIGIWAGHALTVGYALRRVEEEDTPPRPLPDDLPDDRDRASDLVAEGIRSEDPQRSRAYLRYPEEKVVEALDRIIAGEIDRRLSHWEDTIDQQTWEELEDYIAWWVIKGYAMRVVEEVLAARSPAQAPK